MKMIKSLFIVSLVGATLLANSIDPLPSWNSSKVKSSILKYVKNATDVKSKDYIEPQDRITVFDNDGTLWSEQPMYFQLAFTLSRVKEMAHRHPEWINKQPFKAVLENDIARLEKSSKEELIDMVMQTHAGMSDEEFTDIVKTWLATDKHPRFNRYYNELVYQPMLELLDYLRANDFKTFIVSGGGIDFMRPWASAVYGIPPSQIIGSALKVKYENGVVMREPKLHHFDDGAGKVSGIHYHIGQHPVMAFGNSDGDLPMMQYTDGNQGAKTLQLYVHHTDAKREFAYDRKATFGKLDKGLDYAKKYNWSVVDMKKDWKVVYPFELKK